MMPTEATFLLASLFVIAAATGWAIERFFWRERDNQPPARISADYIRGLNLVLNRKTDEALELFVKIAKVDEETLETHFALGHLFRRRGEVERAIRVHQNLLARPSLSEAQRHQALFALAEDYLGAGLFDRAETLFAELSTSATLAQAALEKLVDIYEREREWSKAIDAHRQLERRGGEPAARVAHYYCELAEQARAEGDVEAARSYLRDAEQT
ncbi:MAG TPA: lipopolysaccharide assembly protein LapB, partial [Gammaproteobacteria bacterium]|nr:lipopolysaccharide assembly protein LapB [Gammaproteobacteria bacterium]